jgi:hypothetical protein
MAGSKSDYLENKLLDLVLGAVAYAAPANIFVALFTAAPSDAGGGTECSGGAYARVQLANNATNWPAASAGVKANGVKVTFATQTSNIGTVVAVGLFDALSGGNLLYWGDVAVGDQKTYTSGDVPEIPVGGISISED